MGQAANPFLSEAVTLLLGGGVGAGLLKLVETWASKRKAPSEAAAELIKLAMEASGSSVQQLLTRLDEADQRYNDLSERFDALTQSHAECEQRCDALTAARRDDRQMIESLIRRLRDPNAALAVELNDGLATPLIPEKTR